ncbi:MAG: TonB-dependent receptor [Rubrivivax sp.]|nr:MAG: TonB-dependent receptor [Rubrivivax sp.]
MKSKQYPVGPVAAFLCAAQLALSTAAALAAAPPPEPSALDLDDAAYPVVITPTRLRQSLADVPASVTVITADTLRRYGITRIEDALRFVPGMAVMQVQGNDFRISYHGTNIIAPRRMNVLIDGVSAYPPAFSQVDWAVLPVAMEDIDRIEVIRGPNSASHGPNSMTAVINILTKHPKDVERGLVSVALGSHNMVDTTVRLATTLASTSVRATLHSHDDTGYDRTASGQPARDSTRMRRLNLRAQTDLGDGSSLDLQASHMGGMLYMRSFDWFGVTAPDRQVQSTQASGRWTKSFSANHEVQVDAYHSNGGVRQRWSSCWPRIAMLPQLGELFESNPQYLLDLLVGNPAATGTPREVQLAQEVGQAYAALGLRTSCGQTDQDVSLSRTQVEVQDTFVVSNNLRILGGLGLRYQRANSQTYFGGAVANNVRWAFGHAEYRPLDWLTANVGGYGEFNSLSGSTFSPRFALNARLSDNQSVRFVVSQGTRTPDIFEERANWSYTFTGLTPTVNGGSSTGRLFAVVHGKPNLHSERIRSTELGYLLALRRIGLNLDARVFDDRLTELISDRLTLVDFNPTNSGSVRLSGFELQGNLEFSPTWSGLLAYGYLLNRRATHPIEVSQYSRHSGAAGVSHAFSADWRASLAYQGSSGHGVDELRYSRLDLSVSRAFRAGAQSALATVGIGYLDTPSVHVGAANYLDSTYDSRFSIHGQLRVTF